MAEHTPPTKSQDAQDPFQCPYMKIPKLYVDTLYHLCFVHTLGVADEFIIISTRSPSNPLGWPLVCLDKSAGCWAWATTNAMNRCLALYRNGRLRMVRIPLDAAGLIDPNFCPSAPKGTIVSLNLPSPGG